MFYITASKGMRYHLMSGPYETESQAQENIGRVFDEAQKYYDARDIEDYSVEFLPRFKERALLNLRGFSAAG